MKLQINNPCHESWEGMSPNGNGRHCAACEKVVVDFTNMKDEEIIQFFHRPKEEKVCGRFNSTQVDRILIEEKTVNDSYALRSIQDWSIRMNGNFFGLVLFLAVASSLTSCDSKTTGEVTVSGNGQPAVTAETVNGKNDSLNGTTTKKSGDLTHKVVPTDEKNNCVIPEEGEHSLKGEVEVVQLMGDTTYVE